MKATITRLPTAAPAPSTFAKATADKPENLRQKFSECAVYVLIAASGAMGCWYYIDTDDNPIIMAPLTLSCAIIGALWVEHAANAGPLITIEKQGRKTKRIIRPKIVATLACLCIAAIVNSLGAYRAIDHLNDNSNAPAIARDEARAPILTQIEAAKALQQSAKTRLDAIKPLTPEQRANMPTTRSQNDSAQTDKDLTAATDAFVKASAEVARLQKTLPPVIKRKSAIPPWLSIGWEFINIWGLWTCRGNTKSVYSNNTTKGWVTRRANEAAKRNQKLKQSA